jgi:hypothetical protein
MLESTDGTHWYAVNGLSGLTTSTTSANLNLNSVTPTSTSTGSGPVVTQGSDVANLTLCFQALGLNTVTLDMVHVDIN